MTFDALYADVLASPSDDLPRRVLADWLSEQGDPLGELMRLQLDLAEQGPRAPRSARLGEAELLRLHLPDLQERLAPWAYEAKFSRGLPAMAWTSDLLLAEHGPSARPLPGLHLVLELGSAPPPRGLEDVPLLRHLEALDLTLDLSRTRHGPNPLRPWLELVGRACPQISALRLDGMGEQASDVAALAELVGRLRLGRLALHGLRLLPERAAPLLDALARLDTLEELDLAGTWLSGMGRPLATLVARTRLRWLDVSHCLLEGPAAREVADAAARTGRCLVRVGSNATTRTPNEALEASWSAAALAAARFDARPYFPGRGPVPLRRAVGRVGPWVLQDLVWYEPDCSYYVATSGDDMAVLAQWREPPAVIGSAANVRQARRATVLAGMQPLLGLAHPNLLRWLDAGHGAGGLYAAVELVDGAPLSRVRGENRRAGPPSAADARQAAQVGVDLARALAALHAEGLVQPHLGQDTAWLGRDGRARLAPVALGAQGPRRLRLEEFAPEQLRTRPTDARTDLYRLGAILRWLLSEPGTDPVGLPPWDLARGLLAVAPQLPGTVPPPLQAAIERLLAPDPDQRPGSAEEALVELARAGNLPMTPRPRDEPPDPPDWLACAWDQLGLWQQWNEPDDPRT